MKSEIDRRAFLGTAAATGAFSLIPRHVLGGQARVAPGDKVAVAYIGCGTQGLRELMTMLPNPEIQVVAVCDPVKDSNDYIEWGRGDMLRGIRRFLGKPEWRAGVDGCPGGRDVAKEIVETYYAAERGAGSFRGVTAYADFRELMAKERDFNAVKIMTPDHLHAVIALAAMKQRKGVITHKPIANRIREAKLVMDAARESGAATYFMPYGRGGMELVTGWLKDGAIGTLREIHNWSNRPVWPQYGSIPADRPPVPAGFDWDLWLGPSLDRPYHANYTHTVFRGWYEFGGGAIADMAHYSLWPVFTALELPPPIMVETTINHPYAINERDHTSTMVRNDFSFPAASSTRLRIPAHGSWPEIDVYWHDGGYRPPRPRELEDDRELLPEGMMFVGDSGKILDGRIIPESRMRAYKGPQPPPLNPPPAPRPAAQQGRPAYNPENDPLTPWVKAMKGGPPAAGNFLNAVAITESVNLAAVSMRSGRKLAWDHTAQKITNTSEADKYLTREYRKGWEPV